VTATVAGSARHWQAGWRHRASDCRHRHIPVRPEPECDGAHRDGAGRVHAATDSERSPRRMIAGGSRVRLRAAAGRPGVDPPWPGRGRPRQEQLRQ
jgi:hypothetical protein